LEVKDADIYQEGDGMIPIAAGVRPDIKALAGCLEDCMPFKDGHMERINALERIIDAWTEEEKAGFEAALRLEQVF
jgi:hypothetical protein